MDGPFEKKPLKWSRVIQKNNVFEKKNQNEKRLEMEKIVSKTFDGIVKLENANWRSRKTSREQHLQSSLELIEASFKNLFSKMRRKMDTWIKSNNQETQYWNLFYNSANTYK